MSRLFRWLRWALIAFMGLLLVASITVAVLYFSISAKLPDVHALRDIEMQEPLYVYAKDGQLIAIFGENRRYPIKIEDVPERLKQAFIAIEDSRFYQHNGIDYKGIGRAVWLLMTTDGRVPGGSTITQQVARQFFLSSEYSYQRKFAEMLLAMKMEDVLTKDEILELYLNKSFFGNRAYGVGAATEFYYGKKLDELSLDEMASLAGIPKFPSSSNPLSNPDRAKIRRDYILDRMAEQGFVTVAEAREAKAVPMHATPHEPHIEAPAPYVAEMVRQEMIARYGSEAVTKGYHVITTIDPVLQAAADEAVHNGLRTYDHRHGWHGVEQHFDVPADADAAALAKNLAGITSQADLLPAIVARIGTNGGVVAVLANANEITLPTGGGNRWMGRNPAALLERGDLIRVRAGEKEGEYVIDQIPRGQSALVSLDADTGALRALVGGYSFAGNKFNRATQARRQPGSSFKPFVYAASFDKGYSPASIVLDAPVTFRDRRGRTWSPQNDGGGFRGPMPLRNALVQSRNLVSVRLLDSIGIDFARKYITQFGFNEADLPPNLSMSLGTASLTPLSVARGYAVFANGGSLVTPWFIDEVRDRDGQLIFKEAPAVACRDCAGTSVGSSPTETTNIVDGFNFGALPPSTPAAPAMEATSEPANEEATEVAPALPAETRVAPRAIDPRTAYQLVSMMRDVVQRGTGAAARVLGRADVGGKTGSTNEHRDAWFSGFGGPYATTVWVGRDDFRSLGYREYGGKAALPIWIDYMRVALKDQPIASNVPPRGMVKIYSDGAGGGVVEYVKIEDTQRINEGSGSHPSDHHAGGGDDSAFDIF
ncbi:MAG: penicillin-binding protein 1A [Xanthomonadaceae bacterium]|jgi:penicillin-binding protein 1A|nr:penicillin-binding protein 1A [Xanthomonadaceae bacterium]